MGRSAPLLLGGVEGVLVTPRQPNKRQGTHGATFQMREGEVNQLQHPVEEREE